MPLPQRIKDFVVSGSSPNADDYIPTDGDGAGTRKMLLKPLLDAKISYGGDAYIIVPTTGDNTANGDSLQAAYAAAAALTPGGNALSTTNRACVIIPPGTYDLGTTGLTLAAFVDLVSLTGNPDNVLITSAVTASNGYTVGLAADINVRLIGLTIANSANTQSAGASTEACAFRFTDGGAGYLCKRCYFVTNSSWPMVQGFECAGIFIDCTSEDFGFGANGGEASATFIRCSGGSDCFGGATSHFSGHADNCDGVNRCFGNNGRIKPQGVLKNCSALDDSFAGGTTGDLEGTLFNCTAGSISFGGREIKANARLYSCSAGANSFGFAGIEAAAQLWDCLGTTGCFGGSLAAAGDFHNCVGSHNCFGTAFGGNAWNCTGGDSCFGRTNSQISGGQFVGKAWGCTAGPDSFGKDNFAGWAWDCAAGDGSFGGGGTMIGYAINCSAGEGSFGHGGAFFGVLDHCKLTKTLLMAPLTDSDWGAAWFPIAFGGRVIGTIFSPTNANENAVTLPDGATGSFEFCTFRKTGTGIPLGIDTLGTATMSLSYNKFNTPTGWAVGITNNLGVLATSFNIGDVDV